MTFLGGIINLTLTVQEVKLRAVKKLTHGQRAIRLNHTKVLVSVHF